MRAAWCGFMLLVAACGEKQEPRGDDQLTGKLVDCQSALERAKAATDMCTKQLETAKATGTPTPGEILVRIQGDTLTVTGAAAARGGGGGGGGGGNGGGNLTPEQAEKLSADFNDRLR